MGIVEMIYIIPEIFTVIDRIINKTTPPIHLLSSKDFIDEKIAAKMNTVRGMSCSRNW
jgi:hypothetical protein